ncbi:MAG TPA: ABC transporter permease subunit, partial [Caballeronia sp.]|nr:ABC transporter permease subunit [Caballeronia sp.]
MSVNFAIVFPYWRVLLGGLMLTVAFTLGCAIAGSIGGFVLSLLRISTNRWIKSAAAFYVEIFRGTPLLIQLFWMFFCLPVLFRISIPPALSVLLSLTMYMIAI